MHPLLVSSLAAAAIAGVTGFGTAWVWQGYRMDGLKLEYANEKLAVEQSNREQLANATAAVKAAQDAARVATDRVRLDAAGAGKSAVGLRDALAGAVRSAHTDLEACTRQVDAISQLLATSTEVVRRMAVEADGWAVQAVTLQEAWPK